MRRGCEHTVLTLDGRETLDVFEKTAEGKEIKLSARSKFKVGSRCEEGTENESGNIRANGITELHSQVIVGQLDAALR
ncbi:hypothetical protein TREES_T100008888 [Tupaia chinensis]|uniref:Uncharacterized protein n=1 Tax=Tupaia chinensis TaxID=246437 RepID=L9L5H7_TUPCH|nr:hypothetical protein TREES_T100008888 [Tupaia chinensis]